MLSPESSPLRMKVIAVAIMELTSPGVNCLLELAVSKETRRTYSVAIGLLRDYAARHNLPLTEAPEVDAALSSYMAHLF